LFNASWFIDGNSVPFTEKFFPGERSEGQRKLVVHIDNAITSNSKMAQNFFGHHPLKSAPHPPYSPDISPSDFCLFGKVKSILIWCEIPDEIDLLEMATALLNGISDAELQCVFRSLIEHFERVIDAGGDYLTSQISLSSPSHARSTPLWPV
jgi:hypothetical protein